MTNQPNPGSDQAVAQGCTCPVFDNNHGRRAPVEEGGADYWWVSDRCSLHGE